MIVPQFPISEYFGLFGYPFSYIFLCNLLNIKVMML
ncbi:unknown [Bacteroides sp. CAG:633]|nr:unknown [Bacteroides sp. CAG:633]